MDYITTTHKESDFNPLYYIDINYRNFDPKDESNTQQQMRVFFMKCLQNIYSQGIVNGESLLDIGCGPVCYSPAFACHLVQEITLSDNCPENLSLLRKWMAGETIHLEAVMKYIADISVARHDWKSTDRRVAEKVISVVRGDIRQTIPLAGTGAEDKKFDIVTAILCIACASEDKTAYRQNVLNISNHLKTGGFMIVADCLGKPNYKVVHHIFRVAMMRSGDVREIFLQTRFEILEWIEAPFKEDDLRFSHFQKEMDCITTTHMDTHFNPMDYIDINYRNFDPTDVSNTQQQMRVFFMQSLYKFYSQGIICGETLLDIGCGPVCYSPAFACLLVQEITLSDNCPENLLLLRRWKAGETQHHEAVMRYISDISGSRHNWKRTDRMVAEKVNSIIQGDIRNNIPLSGTEAQDKKFDIVTAILAIITASENEAVYKENVLNISQHLKKGGYIIVADVLGKPFYKVGRYIFRGALLRSDNVKEIFLQTGFEILDWIEAPFKEDDVKFACFCMLARKTI